MTDATGAVTMTTNQFTLLENCLNYFENGQWKESEDVIETAPGGAVASRGPNKASFSPDLNAPAVFDIQTSDGKRLRGGVRAIQLTDVASGKSVTLATVKASAPGELLPPDQIVYSDAFDGLKADVLLTWKHNYFSQDVVLHEQPALPAGMSPDTTRLEILSEMIEAPQPDIRKQPVEAGKAGQLEDDTVIGLGRLNFVMGKAFPVTNEVAWAVGGLNASDDSLPVLKQWQTLPDGRTFLVESIGWTEAQPQLKALPAARQASATPASQDKTAVARVWPERPRPLADAKPMETAWLDYQPNGYVVDFVIIPDQGTPSTLASGQTYYIKSSYYSGSSVTFQAGCTIKYKNNAYMLLYGPISFPSSGYTPVFTSRNDDTFGEKIQGVPNELDSDGDPTKHKAAQAIWIYYVNFSTTIQNARIRWAQKGIQYDGGSVTHTVSNSLFQQSQTGIYFNLSAGTLNLYNVTKCSVTTPVNAPGEGTVNGSMANDCGPLYVTTAYAGVASGEVIDGQNVLNPPDTMGSIGPNHFTELINGAIVIFNRWTGQRIAQMSIDNFFRITVGGTTYPRPPANMNDPRIIYDHRSGRWFAAAKENRSVNENQVILAVSKVSDPVGDPSLDWKNLKWDRFLIQVAEPNTQQDFPTLGTDDNGIYIAVNHLAPTDASLVAIQKSALLASPPTLNATYFRNIPYGTLQPAVNFDSVPANGAAWIVTPRLNANQDIVYATVTWSAGVPSLSGWATLSTPSFGVPQPVPSKNSSTFLYIGGFAGELEQAVIRNSQLWTCRTVGVNASGGAAAPDRNACEWLRLTVSGTSSTLADSGRVYDSSALNPRFYFYPSIMINSRGDMVMGFAGAGNNDFFGAYSAGRMASDPPGYTSSIKTLHAGEAVYSFQLMRWGDYTHTTLDPNNNFAIWTIQQYARTPGNEWRTWINEITPAEP